MKEGKQLKKTSNGGEGAACTCSECGHVPAVAPTDTNTISMHRMQKPNPCTHTTQHAHAHTCTKIKTS